jgi:hypothetical protein
VGEWLAFLLDKMEIMLTQIQLSFATQTNIKKYETGLVCQNTVSQ